MNYPEKIREYREKEFLLKDDLTKLIGVSFVTFNRCENGRFKPTIKRKSNLHKLFIKAHLLEE